MNFRISPLFGMRILRIQGKRQLTGDGTARLSKGERQMVTNQESQQHD